MGLQGWSGETPDKGRCFAFIFEFTAISPVAGPRREDLLALE
jgi:hypothetical protein